MKIYLIGEDDYDGTNILGLYSSREKAVEALPYFNAHEDDIKEFEVDPPNEGEKYEEFYYFNIFQNKEEEHSTVNMQPSDVKFTSYGIFDFAGALYRGMGKTLEEARNNCYKIRDDAHPIWQIFSSGCEFHHADKSAIFSLDKCGTFCAVHEDRNVCIIAIEEYKKTGKVSEFLTVVP